MSRIEQPPSRPSGVTPRKTEDTDTRQAIQRHDPDFYKKKQDDGEKGFKDPYEDLADVSISALRNFLLGLLDRNMAEPAAGAPAPVTTPPADHTRHAASPQAAAAISAYKTGAARGPQAPHYTPAPPPPVTSTSPSAGTAQAPSALDQAASALDKAEVLALVRDLDALAASGITAIALEKTEGGFLASIRGGIARARQIVAGA